MQKAPSHLVVAFLALTITGMAQMRGTYTVDPRAGTAGRTFGSLAEVVQSLATQGVNAPVTIELRDDAGPYVSPMSFVTANATWGANDAVLVLDSFPGTSSVHRVTFKAAPGHRPILDAGARGLAMGVFWNGADHVTLEGLEIRGARHDAISIYSEASHGSVIEPIIRGCTIHGCGGAGIVLYGNLPAPEDALIENNLLYDLQQIADGPFMNTARFGYVSTRRTMRTRIRNNTIVGTTGVGPWFALIGSNPGSLTDEPILEISGNVLSQRVRSDRPVFSFPRVSVVDSIPLFSENNLLDRAVAGPIALVGANGATRLDFLPDWQMATGHDASSVSDTLGFVDLDGRDFRLLPISAARDRGVPGLAPEFDARGQMRDAAPDLGAHEFRSPTDPTLRRLGTGMVGSQGQALMLETDRLPSLGDARFSIGFVGATPGSNAFLFFSTSVAARPVGLGGGATLLLDEVGLAALMSAGLGPLGPMPTRAFGRGDFPLPLPLDPSLAGARVAVQAVIIDAALPPFGMQFSDALDLTLN